MIFVSMQATRFQITTMKSGVTKKEEVELDRVAYTNDVFGVVNAAFLYVLGELDTSVTLPSELGNRNTKI